MGPRKCEVCMVAQSKYKCPSCLVPYCSLPCFKKHKEIPCQKSSGPEEDLKNSCEKSSPHVDNPTTMVNPERLCRVKEESWVLSREKLLSVAESKEIRDALKAEDLRDLINKIDRSKNPEDELNKAIEGQMFHEFTDKILNITSPQE